MEIKTVKKWQDEHKYFLSSERAASEVIGNMFILSIIVIAVSTILLYGVPSIQKLEEAATIKNVEQTYTILDSRASGTILGNSPVQMTDMNLGGGAISIIPNGTSNGGSINKESYMVIQSDNNTFNIVVPMGKLAYSIGDRVVAYEGGGVWSQYPSGSVMLSPPEFNYNGQTLTLPMVNISGKDSQGGNGITRISIEKDAVNPTTILYPTGGNKVNPLNYNTTGKIYVNITSDYYDAWADYISSQLYARVVEKNAATRTARVELRVIPNSYGSRMPLIDPVKMRGLPKKKVPLKNFTFRVYNFDNFNTFDWDIRAKAGNSVLIFHIFKTQLRVGYQENGKSGEIWKTADYPIQTDDIGPYIDINLIDNNAYAKYTNVGGNTVGSDNKKSVCQPYGTKVVGLADPAYSWDTLVNGSINDNQSLFNITQHYISALAGKGDVTLFQCYPSDPNTKNDNRPDSPSSMILDYDAEGDITFLHVTDNRMKIKIS